MQLEMLSQRGLLSSLSCLFLQAILIAAAFKEDWPLLIVCPAALRSMWEGSLADWLPDSVLQGLRIWKISTGKVIARLPATPCLSASGSHKRIFLQSAGRTSDECQVVFQLFTSKKYCACICILQHLGVANTVLLLCISYTTSLPVQAPCLL